VGIGQVKSAVFLDRDGVINRAIVRDGVPHPPDSVEEVEILPGVPEALAKLSQLGLPLVVVTNQPDVARGTQTRAAVEQINDFLRAQLPLTEICICFHDAPDNCSCRKPKAGLLTEAARSYNIDLRRSFMVGDRWSDIVAGQTAGCTTLLIDVSYSKSEKCSPDFCVRDLAEAAEIIAKALSEWSRQ
jgi:D-glycero-D-manno-heptose 1,7-bisphosphate phosphatase